VYLKSRRSSRGGCCVNARTRPRRKAPAGWLMAVPHSLLLWPGCAGAPGRPPTHRQHHPECISAADQANSLAGPRPGFACRFESKELAWQRRRPRPRHPSKQGSGCALAAPQGGGGTFYEERAFYEERVPLELRALSAHLRQRRRPRPCARPPAKSSCLPRPATPPGPALPSYKLPVDF
jgi:hypothetical protein